MLAAVANLLPELLISGTNNVFWCELHALLDVPLPGFTLTQPPAEADAIAAPVPAMTPEPIVQIIAVEPPHPTPVAKVKNPVRIPAKGKKGAKKPPVI